MIKIGLLGLGTVGTGVYEILTNKDGIVKNSVKDEIFIEKVLVNNISKKRNVNINMSILTNNVNDILDNNDINIVIELIGGIDTAYEYIKKALSCGKHVITANKAVVAKHMKELHNIAKNNNVAFLYEASVAGGIPIIKSLKQLMQINKIHSISGIINGTSNYILTCMEQENASFNEILKRAQDLGYAESDPTDDIDGYDMARKIAILSSLAYKVEIKDCDIKTSGIRNISLADINFFKEENFSIKLLASSKMVNNTITAVVEPVLVPKNSVVAQVDSNLNIVDIQCDILGKFQLIGQGAGKEPTANAVVSDILDIINNDYDNFEVVLNKEVALTNDNMDIKNYYIRGSFNSSSDIEKIKKYFNNIIKDIKIKGNDLFCITKKIDIETKDNLLLECKKFANNVFYARI